MADVKLNFLSTGVLTARRVSAPLLRVRCTAVTPTPAMFSAVETRADAWSIRRRHAAANGHHCPAAPPPLPYLVMDWSITQQAPDDRDERPFQLADSIRHSCHGNPHNERAPSTTTREENAALEAATYCRDSLRVTYGIHHICRQRVAIKTRPCFFPERLERGQACRSPPSPPGKKLAPSSMTHARTAWAFQAD
ncbi:hypothetical protein LX36DRAFT_332433 [Colletotrichum falcatum]|nr:hypothetical protein LX36DRAFT_332433 [Colletotrichum falcatum]